MSQLLINLIKRNKLLSIFLFCLYQIIFVLQTNAQTISVNGEITASRFSVHNALITFINNADTTNKFSALTDSSGNYQVNLIITSIKADNILPTKFELEQNYPNPFTSTTVIPYEINKGFNVQVTIYDILGRVVRKFNLGQQATGFHSVLWDGRNNFGVRVAAGIYFYQLKSGSETQVRKMILTKGGKNLIPSPITISPSTAQINKSLNEQIAVSFTVRIENTDSTSPSILTQEFENVLIENDTTLNFEVNKKTIFPASIYLDSTRQIISGFGAANILPWRPDMTDSEIEAAFGAGDGELGFTILRLRVPPNNNQWSINVQTAKKAYDMGVKIIASPWSPPAWMKTNNSTVGGRLNDTSYASYAVHLKNFADFMASNGVPLYAISVQNEPDISVTYESCDWNASQMLRFVKENAPSIGVDIIAPESFNFNHTISDSILNDPVAAANVSIIGGHIYGGGLRPYPLALSKGKEVWMTEHLDTDTSWSHILATGKEINDCMLADMSAYIWWYIVRFYGPIGEDGSVTKRGYVMSQFSRFIRPGYTRINATKNPQPDVYVSAYKKDSSVVIVALNISSNPVNQNFQLDDGIVDGFIPYVTSKTKNCVEGNEINVSNGTFSFTLDGSSITTFVSK